MPHIVRIRKKIITLTESNKLILGELQKALTNSSLKPDESQQAGLVAGEARNISGWWLYLFRVAAEKITERSQGTTACPFEMRDVTLDPPAYILRSYYVNLWNLQPIYGRTKVAVAVENEKIEDGALLVREILVRFFTIALSTEMNVRADGSELVSVITNFLKALRNHPTILSEPLKNFLRDEHGKWTLCLTEMVKKIEELHANKRVMTQTLNYLTQRRDTIARYLITELDQDRETVEYADGQVETTLHDCESKILGAIAPSGSSALTVLVTSVTVGYSTIESTPRQNQVISQCQSAGTPSFFNPARPKHEQIRELYAGLHQNNKLLRVFSALDMSCLTLGWLPFALGLVNISVCDKLLEDFDALCTKILEDRSGPIKKPNINNAFYQHNGTDPYAKVAITISAGFRRLFDPAVQQDIARSIFNVFDELHTLQSLLNVKLVNLDILNGVSAVGSPLSIVAGNPQAANPKGSIVPPVHKPAAAVVPDDDLRLLNELRQMTQPPASIIKPPPLNTSLPATVVVPGSVPSGTSSSVPSPNAIL